MFIFGGYWFGNQPFVENNFSVVVLAIIIISVLPMFVEFIRARRGRAVSAGSHRQAVGYASA